MKELGWQYILIHYFSSTIRYNNKNILNIALLYEYWAKVLVFQMYNLNQVTLNQAIKIIFKNSCRT
jgi:hypothetical protein